MKSLAVANINGIPRTILIDDKNQGCQICPPSIELAKIISQSTSGTSLLEVIEENAIPLNYFNIPTSDFLIPLHPTEIWGAGVTYKKQALEHDTDISPQTTKYPNSSDLYLQLAANPRVEIFFKGNSRTLCYSGDDLHLRFDSIQVLPEAELVLIYGKNNRPVAWTIGNDLTAWDLEKESPFFLHYAKVWKNSSSIERRIIPLIDEADFYQIQLELSIYRNSECILVSKSNSKDITRSIDEFSYFLCSQNDPPAGTLLFTGTGCIIPHDLSLHHNDEVIIKGPGGLLLKNRIVKIDLITTPPSRRISI